MSVCFWRGVHWGCTYATLETVEVKGPIQGSYKLSCQWFAALLADSQLPTCSPPTVVSSSRSVPLSTTITTATSLAVPVREGDS